jgi:hypothetical protein
MFVTVLAPELIAAVAPLAAIGGSMAGTNGMLAGVHGALLPPSADPTAIMTHAFLHGHHAMYQALSAEAVGVHFMTVATMGASGAAYAVSDVANMATML